MTTILFPVTRASINSGSMGWASDDERKDCVGRNPRCSANSVPMLGKQYLTLTVRGSTLVVRI